MLTQTFRAYCLIPALSFLPDGAAHRFPVRALGCWT